MSNAAVDAWPALAARGEAVEPGYLMRLTTPGAAERLCLVLTLSIALAVPFLVGDQPQGADSLNPVKALEALSTSGDAVKQVIFAGLYAAAGGLLVRQLPFRALFFLGAPLLLLILWCFASIGWADDLSVSLRRCAALGGTVLLGTYIGLRFDLRIFLAMMRYVIAVALIGSLLVAAVWPASGFDFEGRLRGVFAHKNALSGFCTVALLVICARLLKFDYRTAIDAIADAGLGLLSIAAMLMAHSSGAVPVLAVALSLLALACILRRADGRLLALLPIMLCVVVFVAICARDHLNAITTMLGRDSDISGRTLIWQFGWKMFLDHFWAGYGYGVFWEGFNSPGAAFWSVFHLGAPHSHNGYLQLALDAGAVGIGLFVAALLTVLYKLAWLVRQGPDALVSWAAAFLGLFLSTNLVETRLWVGNQIDTVLFVYIVVNVNLSVSARCVKWRREASAGNLAAPSRLSEIATWKVL